MGVEDELLGRKKKEADFNLPGEVGDIPTFDIPPPPPKEPALTPEPAPQAQNQEVNLDAIKSEHLTPPPKPKAPAGFPQQLQNTIDNPKPRSINLGGDPGVKGLRKDIQQLNHSIGELLEIFKAAHSDIKEEPANQLAEKLDKLVTQNEEMARSILLMLELNREHLPNISRHTRVSNELKLRKPRRHHR